MIHIISEKIKENPSFCEALGQIIAGRTPIAVTGMGAVSRAVFCHAFSQKAGMRALVIVPDEDTAAKAAADLSAFFENVRILPARDIDFFQAGARSRGWEYMRLETLSQLSQNKCDAVIATPEALLQYTVSPENIKLRTFEMKVGDTLSREEIVSRLVHGGYTRCDLIEGKGQFAVRGGIIDIFPVSAEAPIRLELWGDEIDSMGTFDLATQRRSENIDSAVIAPAIELALSKDGQEKLEQRLRSFIKKADAHAEDASRLRADLEALQSGTFTAFDRYAGAMTEQYCTFFDYDICKYDMCAFLYDEPKITAHIKGYYGLLEEDIKSCLERGLLPADCGAPLAEKELFYRKISQMPALMLDSFAHSYESARPRAVYPFTAKQLSGFSGNTAQLLEDVRGYIGNGFNVVLAVAGSGRVDTVCGLLSREGIATYTQGETLRKNAVLVVNAHLSAGAEFTAEKVALLCDTEAVRTRRVKPKKAKSAERIKSYNDLHIGDFIVHYVHGIGQYLGIEKLTVSGVTKDFIKIRYSGADALYIPTNQLDQISKYVSADSGAAVKLSKIGGNEWEKTKSRVKKAVADMADKLIALYAERENIRGFAFSPDTEWQKDFEAQFPYEETDDQLTSAREIKKDMEKPVPMDRLLCGDVGFGKTEVALRAVFKCVSDGRQAAILVPTTILAWQHYETILKRFANVPVNIEVMSRYRTKKQQEEIARKLRRGEIDIIIGTHRLLQKDVQFKALGLVVVDEEQRFGVVHKERLKELTKEVDVLTLTATPIPRTLNMALSGIRDMSLLEEPPRERQTVATYVLEHDDTILAEAMRQELRRSGQILYLYNRVEGIQNKAAKIQKLLPDANIAFAHGKMSESELSAIWEGVVAGEIDVLVCTTIIETGIDLPNANTLIIEDADRLGLSQLYQLRGRVGRSHRRAYCYLTYRRGKVLTEEAEKRLSAIKEFTEFGSGFKIAMRDLEIRGAGNVLGAQQHGHMEAVGYDLYVKLLENAVKEKKGEEALPERECLFDLNISAHIPFDYIESAEQRIDIYKKIATLSTSEDYYDMTDELLDRFGEIPEEVDSLCRISLIRNLGTRCRIKEIYEENGRAAFTAAAFNLEKLALAADELSGRMTYIPSTPPVVTINPARGNSLLDEAEIFLNLYSQ